MMLLWVVFSALTAAVVGALLRPARRARGEAGADTDADVAVYADQLAQIEDDRAKGIVSEAEAQSARAEIGRRLLSRASTGDEAPGPARGDGSVSERLIQGIAIAIPVAALALYVVLGSPGLPGQPHGQRLAAKEGAGQVETLIAKVEDRLQSAPNDGNGWDVIAPIYLRLQRFDKAAEAFANANRILGETPKRLAGFVQAEILANDGRVTPNARSAAERLLALEPERIDTRLWLTLAKEQDGKLQEALADYRAILGEARVTDDIRGAVEQRMAIVEARAKGELPPAGSDQPPPAALSELPPAASSKLPPAAGPGTPNPVETAPGDQKAFIESMVSRLAARLAKDGTDAAGWAQLVRSYMVLGRRVDALKALGDATAALKGDDKGLAEVAQTAREVGLEPRAAADGKDVKP